MEISDFIDQFAKLREKELEQKTWELWLAAYPHMSKDNFVSYEEMLATAKQREVRDETSVNGIYVDQCFF
jgi:hypothetical protein